MHPTIMLTRDTKVVEATSVPQRPAISATSKVISRENAPAVLRTSRTRASAEEEAEEEEAAVAVIVHQRLATPATLRDTSQGNAQTSLTMTKELVVEGSVVAQEEAAAVVAVEVAAEAELALSVKRKATSLGTVLRKNEQKAR